MAKSGELPSVRIGKSIRIPELALSNWLNQNGIADAVEATDHTERTNFEPSEILTAAGLGKLKGSTSIQKLTPALSKLGRLMNGRPHLERWMVREECIARLTKARVRMPARAVDLALGLTRPGS